MTCQIENCLEGFEFHDAWLTLNRFDGEGLTVKAEYVNVRKNAGFGALSHDMELNNAKITFQGFCAATFEPGRAWKTDTDGRSYTDDPLIFFDGKDAERLILEELRNGINVYGMGKKERNRYYIEGCGLEPFFVLEFYAGGVMLEWDGYGKKAWYELHRQSWREAVLYTPEGRRQVTLHVTSHDKDVCHCGNLEEAPLVTVGIKYGGKDLWGKGTDERSAFAALQKQLPQNIVILLDN